MSKWNVRFRAESDRIPKPMASGIESIPVEHPASLLQTLEQSERRNLQPQWQHPKLQCEKVVQSLPEHSEEVYDLLNPAHFPLLRSSAKPDSLMLEHLLDFELLESANH